MSAGFQKTVNQYLPIGVEGDFASANPYATVDAGEAALVAGPTGLQIARFAWIGDDGRSVSNFGSNNSRPDGFVGLQQALALITDFSAETSFTIQAGREVTLYNEGDFFIRATADVLKGVQVYASYADGSPSFGSAPAGATATGSIGSTFTATGSGTNLTTSAVTGLISVGDTIAGTGIPAGTKIVSQTSGTTGGAGVYVTSAATTIAAATGTSFGNVLNVSAVGTGTLKVGEPITGTGVPAGTVIASQVSGAAGGVGVYTIDTPATAYAASTALTVTGGIATNFYTTSSAASGELVKMGTWGKL